MSPACVVGARQHTGAAAPGRAGASARTIDTVDCGSRARSLARSRRLAPQRVDARPRALLAIERGSGHHGPRAMTEPQLPRLFVPRAARSAARTLRDELFPAMHALDAFTL